jgi:hypothetical protein
MFGISFGPRVRIAARLVAPLAALALVPVAWPAAQANQSGLHGRQDDFAVARAATAGFKHPGRAVAAGWGDSGLPCFDSPGVGGMGMHYLKAPPDGGRPDAANPEALVYEVRPDGSQDLVAVEYLVNRDTWPLSTAPSLFDEPFKKVDLPGDTHLWALHAWIWRPNPLGINADYNPNVAMCS